MKISYSWLNNYLNLELPHEEVSALLTDIGLEVEGVEEVERIKGGLKGVIIGEVLTKTGHPNADRLAITTVNIGDDVPLQIVCGAPNVAAGQKVPVATVGTILYDGDKDFKIKKSKIRGEVSEGMICGADEIGLGEDTDGIMVLDTNAKVGLPASAYFQLDSDIVFEIGLTPNRSDAMGHIGVARDLITVLNHRGAKLQMCLPSVKAFEVESTTKNISVELKDTKLCPRYSGVSISGIKVASSPDWLQNRLRAIGLTPVNNVVDITNYVLHETGQPLHAFDIAKISGNKVVVSTVKNKSKFIALDEIERELSSDDLMINDANRPMCIAGIYGGIDSGVSDTTVDVFLESAYFDPVSIRKTAKRHGLSTDASFRYERGCDPNITVYALKRAALLITEICGGAIASDIVDIYPSMIQHFPVQLSYSKMDNLIGEVIDRELVQGILNDLEIEIVDSNNDGLSLLVPPFRTDVQREVDVIEEILRIYGFNTVSIPSKLDTIISYSQVINIEEIRNTISDLLSNSGFNEAMNNSLTKDENTKLISELDIEQNVVILNPLSKDLNVMRQSLLFSGLENIAYNHNRKSMDIKIYEFGKTYRKKGQKYSESQHLQVLVSGRLHPENWNANSDKADFFFIKEKVEHILNRLGIKDVQSEQVNTYGFEEALMYKCKNKRLVCFGKLDNKICKAFDVKSEVYAADFDWDTVLDLVGHTKTGFQEISKFPVVRRDLSLLVDKSVSFDKLRMIAIKVDNKILKSVSLFDVYEGSKLPDGKKSYALAFTMGDATRTLTDMHVDKVMKKLMNSFRQQVGAEIR
ncbi:MAG: phenylalanine--tRNA ligase subunit beta [Flavobacteriales bacterium]|nr:phenylalanine--tRNA ligase subunit beta [Flavobacteriales bacterium]|tara:strand:- start:7500 stop:9923 length:2424 start_codon:yes stop_codon:yes gene_type:complete